MVRRSTEFRWPTEQVSIPNHSGSPADLQAVVAESSGPFGPLWDELMDEAERLLHEP